MPTLRTESPWAIRLRVAGSKRPLLIASPCRAARAASRRGDGFFVPPHPPPAGLAPPPRFPEIERRAIMERADGRGAQGFPDAGRGHDLPGLRRGGEED